MKKSPIVYRTIRVKEDTYKKIKMQSIADGKPMTRLITELITQRIEKNNSQPATG